jgi:hypothetical protein
VRTTVTLDEDVAAKLRQVSRERGVSFKAALNGAIRLGLSAAAPPARSFRVHALPLGVRPSVDLDKALNLAGEVEDSEILRKFELRK